MASGNEAELSRERIDATFRALYTLDPAAAARLAEVAGAGMPAEDVAAGEELFAAAMMATEDFRDRQAAVWDVLIAREWDTPPSWAELFDDLSPERGARLGELYDVLPDGARAEYDRRFGQRSDA